MKLNEVIAKYGNQEVDESKIKEVLGVKESKVWKPKKGEQYFYNSNRGTYSTVVNCGDDENLFNIGNCFKTKSEAEFARDKQIFLTKFERYLRENEDEPVDWNNYNQDKYCVVIERGINTLDITSWYSRQFQGVIYTTNEESLKKFIENNEADIKKYMFGIV